MAQRVAKQTYSLGAGLLGDSLEARKDLKRYYDGALEARNFTSLSHGGMKRRGGLRFGCAFDAASTGAEIARFEFNKEQVYLIGFTNNLLTVFMDWQQQTAIVAPWISTDLSGLDFTQQLDTMLVAHAATQTQKLERQGDHTSWALSALSFTNMPTYRFGAVTTGTGTPTAATGSTTFTAVDDEFTFPGTADVGKWIVGNQGKAVITAVTSAKLVNIDVKQDFKDTSAIEAGDWSIEENVWSDARGWPASIDFYQGRTMAGGSSTLLDKVWGSRSGKFFDFKNTWEALDDESLDATLTHGNQVNQVKRVSAMQSLFAFTTGGLFAVNESSLTPSNFLPVKNSAVPSASLPPIELEETVAFVGADESGTATGLYQLVVDANSNATRYVAENLSLLCPHVMTGPNGIATRKGATPAGAQHVFISNDDGTAAVLHSRRSQNMLAWTWWDSPGNSGTDKLQRPAVVGGTVAFLVERTIGGVKKYFIEYLDDDAFFDSSVKQTDAVAKSAWAGFGHLEGETLKVWADGALRDDAVVTGGVVTVMDGGTAIDVTEMEAGMALDWALEPMPPVLGEGMDNAPYRIFKADIRMRGAYEIAVNGRSVALRRMGSVTLNSAPEPFAGVKTIRFLGRSRGETKAATVSMTGQLPITIESIATHVAM